MIGEQTTQKLKFYYILETALPQTSIPLQFCNYPLRLVLSTSPVPFPAIICSYYY